MAIVRTIILSWMLLAPVLANWYDAFSCYSRASEVCRLKDIILDSDRAIQSATFENIRDPLVIESGKIEHFSRELASKLSNVLDLTVDRLGIVQLYIRPTLVHLSAVENAIERLVLDESDERVQEYSMLTLHLSSNKLKELPALDRFVRLMTLALDNNLLTAIDMATFSSMKALRVLTLAHNRLVTVSSPPDTPIHLQKLGRLSFAGNQLALLDIRNWEFDSLRELNLTGNGLTRLEGNLAQFPALKALEIAGNRWYCEWLLMVRAEQESARFTLDSDQPGRCRDEHMMTSLQHCCNPLGPDAAGVIDVYGDKWDELKRLTQLLDKLNHTIANGSATVKPVLEAQLKSLNTQLAKLLDTQSQHSAELKRLDAGIDQQKSKTSKLELVLTAKVDELREIVDTRWNHTMDVGLYVDALANDTTTPTGPHWPSVAAQNEKTLNNLRILLDMTSKQFNLYSGKSYEQNALLKALVERLSTVQGDVDRVRLNGQEIQQQLGKMEPTVDLIYQFLKDVREGCIEDID
uniref:Leucine-rich immune protein (Short) n=1 Tax=Anopheles epiroticus TaxID=199890 RepID=A0A182PQG8_9DIPT